MENINVGEEEKVHFFQCCQMAEIIKQFCLCVISFYDENSPSSGKEAEF
jgi:hypothetical protein